MMRIQPRRFALAIEPAIGQWFFPFTKHMKVRLKLALAMDEASDQLAISDEIHLSARATGVLALFDFPGSALQADRDQHCR
jgi:hypothetical protein